MGESKRRKQLDLSYGRPNLDLIAVQGIKFGLDNLVNASCHLSGEIACLFSNNGRGVPEVCIPMIVDALCEQAHSFSAKIDFSYFVTKAGESGDTAIKNAVKILEITVDPHTITSWTTFDIDSPSRLFSQKLDLT